MVRCDENHQNTEWEKDDRKRKYLVPGTIHFRYQVCVITSKEMVSASVSTDQRISKSVPRVTCQGARLKVAEGEGQRVTIGLVSLAWLLISLWYEPRESAALLIAAEVGRRSVVPVCMLLHFGPFQKRSKVAPAFSRYTAAKQHHGNKEKSVP